jgi:hypothetical protein
VRRGASARRCSGNLIGGHSFNSLAPELAGRAIDLDHEGVQIGELVHVELANDDRIVVVGILDDDAVTRIQRPVYLSSGRCAATSCPAPTSPAKRSCAPSP